MILFVSQFYPAGNFEKIITFALGTASNESVNLTILALNLTDYCKRFLNLQRSDFNNNFIHCGELVKGKQAQFRKHFRLAASNGFV